MKGYVKPEAIEISDMMETVGLSSGNGGGGSNSLVMWWSGHDSGSMSEMHAELYSAKGLTHVEVVLELIDSNRTLRSFEGEQKTGVTYDYYNGKYGDARGIKIVVDIPSQLANNDRPCTSFGISSMVFLPGPYDENTPDTGFRASTVSGDRIASGSYCIPADMGDARYHGHERVGVPYEGESITAAFRVRFL